MHRAGPGAWAVAVLGLALCAGAATLGFRLVTQQRADSAELNAARLRSRAPLVVAPVVQGPRISEAQAAGVNAAILQLNLPWRALYDAIAAATPPGIGMLALEPDARKRSLKITAEAKSSDAMIEYVELLKREELFAGVTLIRHEINEQDPNKPIRFQLEAEWVAP
nr:PilN domain-containing protein [Massilia rubra]